MAKSFYPVIMPPGKMELTLPSDNFSLISLSTPAPKVDYLSHPFLLDILTQLLSKVVVWSGILWTISFLFVCIYRLTYHPLAKYPGPFLAKISGSYASFHSLKGDMHIDIARCHKKYGNFVRYGPDQIVVNTAKGLHDIYRSNDRVIKSKAYIPLQWDSHTTNTISCRNKYQAKHRRRALACGFSDAAIKSFEPILTKLVDKLCDLIGGEVHKSGRDTGWSSPMNMAQISNYFTLDAIGELGFGRDFNVIQNPQNRFLRDVIEGSLIRTNILVQYPFLLNTGIDKLLYPKGLLQGHKFMEVCREYVDRTMQEKNYKKDLISEVLQVKDKVTGEAPSSDQIWEECKFIVAAGSETSAVALAGVFFYLSRYPAAYSRLAEEIRTTFTSFEDITMGRKLGDCQYLRSCIDESLRMSPPTPISLWREIESNGITVDGEYFPPGYDIGVGIYSIHHSSEIYRDPFNYHPERWLVSDNNPQECVDRARAGFNPFSVGPRACPAQNLALAELKLVLARVIFEFDFRRPDGPMGLIGEKFVGSGVELGMASHITSSIKGPFLEFRKRS